MVVLQNPPIQKSFEFNDDVSYLSAHLLNFYLSFKLHSPTLPLQIRSDNPQDIMILK
jgi:hypothetical protein